MGLQDRASTGIQGLDQVIDDLRLGDNVVWQVDSVQEYKKMVEPYVKQAKNDGRRLVYFRFGDHDSLLPDDPGLTVYHVDPRKGFESFATEVHNLITREGKKVFYLFDCLTDLLACWYSDLMIGNFFRVTCPYLYELDTIAYFAIVRNFHTYSTIAGIRETTQLLFDLYQVNDNVYIHPLKAWQRYSPTMFFPHLIRGQEAICITASSEAAQLFSSIHRSEERLDNWNIVFNRAREVLEDEPERQEATRRSLMRMLIGNESRMFALCDRYFTLRDILLIASREVGTGFIGGKSVGMLVARKILETRDQERFAAFMEPHDSYYIGSDIFYTYIVQNGWWKLRTWQKTREGYYKYAPELKEKLLNGRFPQNIREQFVQMLEYFGQSPIIVRSSSLLEDNYGNAFAGKYESVFCANQGTPEERYEAFEQAIRTVYASVMNEDALAYRLNRGLFERDEQMALLVQRVSGDQHNGFFFPHVAGVGNSSNLYVWDESIDVDSGMLRLVLGLGTRAVDRTEGDYARIVCLDDPLRIPHLDAEDQRKFSQKSVDVISLPANALNTVALEDVVAQDIKTDEGLFMSPDYHTADRLQEMGYTDVKTPYMLDFRKLLAATEFPAVMRDMLALLAQVYDYPVDLEFTANFSRDGRFKVNLLQCRPLQTKGLGQPVAMPELVPGQDCFMAGKGNFMGGNVRLPLDYIIYIDACSYLSLSEQEKYALARQIGQLNTAVKGKHAMLVGPGRWGSTTPSLGVPLHFTELCNMAVICEVASQKEGFMPELSYGSHFFLDLVEAGIFYLALFDGSPGVVFNPEYVLSRPNVLHTFLPGGSNLPGVMHVASTPGMELFSDIRTQSFLCR